MANKKKVPSPKPFNPLQKETLGTSVADAMLAQKPVFIKGLSEFNGAGIYAIYYTGNFPAYRKIKKENENGKFLFPVYVGKADPSGSRKGRFGLEKNPGPVLFKRIREHAENINQVTNIALEDFFCRYLVVDDIWIPLGESLIIENFKPIWNLFLEGFGNHDPGKGRYNQQRSAWDVVHPGRPWAEKCAPNNKSESQLLNEIKEFLKTPLHI